MPYKKHNYQVNPVKQNGIYLFFAQWYVRYNIKGKQCTQKVHKEELIEVSPLGVNYEYARKRAIELWSKIVL